MKIKTDFKKFKETEPPSRWARLYHAGTEWFMLWESLEEQARMGNGQPFFYVRPFVTGIIIEIFVKSIVLQEDPNFNPLDKQYRHRTTNIINIYKEKIPVLNEIANDAYLISLIKSYEDTIDTKFGETSVSFNVADAKKVTDAAFKIREIIRIKAGFKN